MGNWIPSLGVRYVYAYLQPPSYSGGPSICLEFERGVIVHRNLAADVFPTVNFEKHRVWVSTCTLVCYWWL